MVTALTGMLALGGVLHLGNTMLEKRLAYVRQERTKITSAVNKAEKIIELKKKIREKEELVAGNALRQPAWEGILKEIGTAIPSNAILTELLLVPMSVPLTIKLSGVIYAGNRSVDSELSSFMSVMTVSPFFLQFDLVSRKNQVDEARPSSTFDFLGVLEY